MCCELGTGLSRETAPCYSMYTTLEVPRLLGMGTYNSKGIPADLEAADSSIIYICPASFLHRLRRSWLCFDKAALPPDSENISSYRSRRTLPPSCRLLWDRDLLSLDKSKATSIEHSATSHNPSCAPRISLHAKAR